MEKLADKIERLRGFFFFSGVGRFDLELEEQVQLFELIQSLEGDELQNAIEKLYKTIEAKIIF
jgi:hypothetical protein